MRFQLDPLLAAEQVEQWRGALLDPASSWLDGQATAGWHARGIKRNQQLDRDSVLHQRLAAELEQALWAHPLVQAAALPRRIHGILFSRMGIGDGYGRHVDNAFMAGGRSDLSFTLFLSPPDPAAGGALVLEDPSGEESVALPVGHALVYPSSQLHRVEPVRAGERLVAVGWIESRVRRSDQRELLFELDTVRRSLFASEGKGDRFDLLCRCYSNLLRQWGE